MRDWPTTIGTNRTDRRRHRGKPKPGELLIEFVRERDHTRWLCELRTHPEPYGVEALFYRNEEFDHSRRFDQRMDPTRPPRELAIAWAQEWRKGIEEDGM